MNRSMITVVVLALFSSLSFGQVSQVGEGAILVSGGMAAGALEGRYGSMNIPPLFVDVGFFVSDHIAVSGLAAYSHSRKSFGDPGIYSSDWSINYCTLGAEGQYHLGDLIKGYWNYGNKNFDPYAGCALGYNIVTSSFTYSGVYGGPSSPGKSYLFFDLHIGARYYFTPELAGMMELGYGLGILKIGLTYNL